MRKRTMLWSLVALLALGTTACAGSGAPKSTSGVSQASVKVDVGADGLTTEQRNVRDRLVEDNKPGETKHLYVISPESGQVILYSTVRGKVTSSGKRLAPTTVASSDSNYTGGIPVKIGNRDLHTSEVLQDDGSYGSSVPYIYWWDTKGAYHQHFFTEGQIIHVSSQPIAVKSVVINLETDIK